MHENWSGGERTQGASSSFVLADVLQRFFMMSCLQFLNGVPLRTSQDRFGGLGFSFDRFLSRGGKVGGGGVKKGGFLLSSRVTIKGGYNLPRTG